MSAPPAGHTPRYWFEDLALGTAESYTRTVTEDDIEGFARVTGDTNPLHLDEAFARTSPFRGRIAHGMLSACLIGTIFGTLLPGTGCIYLSQTVRFLAPVRVGDTVTATATVAALDPRGNRVTMRTECRVGLRAVVEGEATVHVPSRRG